MTFAMSGNYAAGAFFTDAIHSIGVEVDTDKADERFSYEIRWGGHLYEEGTFTLAPGATRTINVPEGAGISVTAILQRGDKVEWDDGHSAARTFGPTHSFTVSASTPPTTLTAHFTSSGGWAWGIWIVPAALFLLGCTITFFLMWNRVSKVSGTVTKNGKGVWNVRIEYTIDGNPGSATTDDNGNYRIYAPDGSDVVITSVSKAGLNVSETLPLTMTAEKRGVKVNFGLSE
jgi:hypothetical protein